MSTNYFEYVLASETFDDNNKGFEFGVNWLDNNGDVVDCEWFKTEIERAFAVENSG